MKHRFFALLQAGNEPCQYEDTISDDELKLINGLKQNGPLRPLKTDEIHVRAMFCIGESPTTKMSIHPERELNGKKVSSLARLANLLPGAPMMEGHRMDKVPWARVYKAEVQERNGEKMVKAWYYFLAGIPEYEKIAREIDAGIRSEGSISYWYTEARCSICHTKWDSVNFFGQQMVISKCDHKLGEDYDVGGEKQVCYYYPSQIKGVAELSHVYRGAFQKTAGSLNSALSDEEKIGYDAVEEALKAAGEKDVKVVKCGKCEALVAVRGELPSECKCGSVVKLESASPEEDQKNQTDGTSNTESTETDNTGKTGETEPKTAESAEGKSGDAPATDGEGAADSQPAGEGEAGSSTAESEAGEGEGEPATGEPENAGGEPEGTAGQESEGEGQPDNTPGGNAPDDQGGEGETEGGEAAEGEAGTGSDAEPAGAEAPENEPEGGQDQTDESTDSETDPMSGESAADESGAGEAGETGEPASGEPEPGNAPAEESENAADGSSAKEDLLAPQKGSDAVATHSHDKSNPKGQHRHSRSRGTKAGDHSHEDGTDGVHTEVWSIEKKEGKHRHDASNPKGLHKHTPDKAYLEGKKSANCECGLPYEIGSMELCDHCGVQLVNKVADLKFGVPAGPVKPRKSGSKNNEFFDIEGFADLEGEYFIEPKYDGVWMEIHRKGDDVKIFSDEGNEHSAKFPNIVEDAKSENGDDYIIAGEMVKMRGRQRLGHSDVTAYLQSADSSDDKAFRFKAFDVMLSKGSDLRKEPLRARRKVLDALVDNSDQIQRTKFERVKGGDKLPGKIREIATREGTMVKNVESEYTPEGEKETFKWKIQSEVDCEVLKREEKDGGGFVYTCGVGSGDQAQEIGKTFATSIKADKGAILRVSVDKVTKDDEGNFTWFAPKVLERRDDKKNPDPISTLDKIAVRKGAGEPDQDSNVITLGQVTSKLLSFERSFLIYLTGGLVEKGYSTNDIDILVTEELTEEQTGLIRNALGEALFDRVDINVDPSGPAGPSIELRSIAGEQLARAWKYAGKFVMQKHWWGKKAHWDLRFGAPRTPRMWGWTCFKEPTKSAGGQKVMCQEKKYHDPKWMGVDGIIKPGQPGNPTKNLNAFMRIKDEGSYDFVQRKPKFLEVVLHGKKWKGRYVFREIPVKKGTQNVLDQNRVEGDEVGVKSKNIWVMWKPKDQEPGKKINKIAYNWTGATLTMWETDEPDAEAYLD